MSTAATNHIELALVGRLFVNWLRPQIPDDWAQPNHGVASPLGEPLTEDSIDRIRLNISYMMALSS